MLTGDFRSSLDQKVKAKISDQAYLQGHRWHILIILSIALFAGLLSACTRSNELSLTEMDARKVIKHDLLRTSEAEGQEDSQQQAASSSEDHDNARPEETDALVDKDKLEEIKKVDESSFEPLDLELHYYDPDGEFQIAKGAFGPQKKDYPNILDWIKAAQAEQVNLGQGEYEILVFLKEQVLCIYELAEGQRILTRAFKCSSGEAESPTPMAQTSIGVKHTEGLMFDGSFAMYCSQINGNILIHSVPSAGKNGQIGVRSSEYNKLGQPASHGCIRLSCKDAKYIYDNIAAGTKVTVLAGAKGYPEVPKNLESIKVPEAGPEWDPTNPNPDNPYLKEPELLLDANR